MSLRTKLLSVFAALAVLPLITLGVFDYTRSLDAVHRLIGDQTAPIASRVARRVAERLAIINGDLRLLAGNTETPRMYAAATRRAIAPVPYFDDAWRVLGASYDWLSFRDTAGMEVRRFGQGSSGDALDVPRGPAAVPVLVVSVPVRSVDTGQPLGSVVAAIKIDALVPSNLLESHFGNGGYTVLAQALRGQVFDPAGGPFPRGAPAVPAFTATDVTADSLFAVHTVEYIERDSARIASVATIPSSDLIVISAGTVDEFAGTFARIRVVNLTLALAFTVVLMLAFVVVTRRVTRPLETLTAAAAAVGQGNFMPSLPAAGDDEVGRLSDGFAAMSGHIQRMVHELEASRQMAAVGSFARQVAHEIRNPLTSIKLNLQSLERDVRAGLIPDDRRRTVEICLAEIQRLDRVVRGVLALGADVAEARQGMPIASIVGRALQVIAPQLEQQGVVLEYDAGPEALGVVANETQLVGTFLNLFVNAADAMPSGGTLRVAISAVSVDGLPRVRVVVSDSGPGVSMEARAQIFEPFYTTKAKGSGLGLAVALRDVEQHQGRIALVGDDEASPVGASFVVDLPASDT